MKKTVMCELCGKEVENRMSVMVEGTEMKVCNDCKSYGSKKERVKYKESKKRKASLRHSKTVLKQDYGSIIRKKREGLGESQEDLADKLNIKESVLQKIENNKLRPARKLALKLEKTLRIDLFEKVEDNVDKYVNKADDGEGLTLGDMIKFKK